MSKTCSIRVNPNLNCIYIVYITALEYTCILAPWTRFKNNTILWLTIVFNTVTPFCHLNEGKIENLSNRGCCLSCKYWTGEKQQ